VFISCVVGNAVVFVVRWSLLGSLEENSGKFYSVLLYSFPSFSFSLSLEIDHFLSRKII